MSHLAWEPLYEQRVLSLVNLAGQVLNGLPVPFRTLNNNNITTIPVSSFNHMPKLRTL